MSDTHRPQANYVAGLGLVLWLSACAPAPVPSPSPSPPTAAAQASPTSAPPTATAKPAVSPTRRASATADASADMWRLNFYAFELTFDPADWALSERDLPALAHQRLERCKLLEQGPTEYPGVEATAKNLAGIEYRIFAFASPEKDVRYAWYAAVGGFENPEPGNTPIVIVQAPAELWQGCRRAAEGVLATLGPAD